MHRKYSDIEIDSLLFYVVNKVSVRLQRSGCPLSSLTCGIIICSAVCQLKDESSLDLLLLRELISNMAGIEGTVHHAA